MDFKTMKESALKSLEKPGASPPLPKTKDLKKPILYIFRHCQTYDNVKRIFSGRRQTLLTPKGRDQAEILATKLSKKQIDIFVSPPVQRCIDTLKPVLLAHPDSKYITKKNLEERDYGILTGKSKMQIMREYPEEAIYWRRSWDVSPPKGESLKDVWQTRIEPFCYWLNRQLKHGKSIGYCGTNNTLRLVRMYFEKLSIEEMLEIEMPYADYASYNYRA
jgi:2,3-bisphosphoglycerate-dependent phosphoglycerate mutase